MKKFISLLLCAVMMVSLSGCSDKINVEDYLGGFPCVDTFESDMNDAIEDFLSSSDLDEPIEDWAVTDFQILDAPEEVADEYEQMFYCKYYKASGNTSLITLGGFVCDGRVVNIYATLPTPPEGSSYSAEEVAYLLPIAMIPYSLFDDTYNNNYDSLFELEQDIFYGDDNGDNKRICTINGITHMLQISSTTNSYTLSVKELWNEKCKELADAYYENEEYDKSDYYYSKANLK